MNAHTRRLKRKRRRVMLSDRDFPWLSLKEWCRGISAGRSKWSRMARAWLLRKGVA